MFSLSSFSMFHGCYILVFNSLLSHCLIIILYQCSNCSHCSLQCSYSSQHCSRYVLLCDNRPQIKEFWVFDIKVIPDKTQKKEEKTSVHIKVRCSVDDVIRWSCDSLFHSLSQQKMKTQNNSHHGEIFLSRRRSFDFFLCALILRCVVTGWVMLSVNLSSLSVNWQQ